MDRILDYLTARIASAPHDSILSETIAFLSDIQRRPDGPYPVSWDTLQRNFQQLRDRGLWERSSENDELLDALRTLLVSSKPSERVSIVIPPVNSLPPQLISNQDNLLLPVELVDLLNKAHFIHVLATDPAQVLPPGKSLLSVLSRAHTTADGDTKLTLRSKVEDAVHKAFWDEAVSTLSSPEPSIQLPRIKLLYSDLYIALSPLLPHKHPVLVTLSSPLSPTSSPLNSAVMHLREILNSLRERCAPVRDPDIEALQQQLSDLPARSSPLVSLATVVVDTVRNILRLSEFMKDDLSMFVLGSMTEQQLRSVVTKEAKTTEREIVINVWHRDRIIQGWSTWLDGLQPPDYLSSISTEPRLLWIIRVVQALESSHPVSCPLPSRTIEISQTVPPMQDNSETTVSPPPSTNTLPAVFFLSAPALLKIQNYLQALVIAASLRVLTRLPLPTRSSTHGSDPPDPDSFMSRVWTLLRAEISGEPGASDTKLINLADEVVRARMQATAVPSAAASGTLSKEDEAALRAAVDRTLRPDDPVYKLLQRRLLAELANALVKRRQGEGSRDVGAGVGPATLRTGRDSGERAGKRPRLVLDPEETDGVQTASRSPLRMAADVKGFEDPVLSRAVAGVFQELDDCLRWVEGTWDDVIETRFGKDA